MPIITCFIVFSFRTIAVMICERRCALYTHDCIYRVGSTLTVRGPMWCDPFRHWRAVVFSHSGIIGRSVSYDSEEKNNKNDSQCLVWFPYASNALEQYGITRYWMPKDTSTILISIVSSYFLSIKHSPPLVTVRQSRPLQSRSSAIR